MRDDTFVEEAAASHLDGYSGPLDAVVDVGAHVGGFSRAALRRGASRVVAVEPNAENFSTLARLTADYPKQFFPIRASVGPRAMLRRVGVNSGQFSTVIPGGYPDCLPPSMSLPDLLLLAGGDVDLLKVDIEGAEHLAIKTTSDLAGVRAIHIELHDLSKPWGDHVIDNGTYADCMDRLVGVLRSAGFAIHDEDRLRSGVGCLLLR
jgi:FkbM family methyltransferase